DRRPDGRNFGGCNAAASKSPDRVPRRGRSSAKSTSRNRRRRASSDHQRDPATPFRPAARPHVALLNPSKPPWIPDPKTALVTSERKQVCVQARQARPLDLIGSMADKDTASCKATPSLARSKSACLPYCPCPGIRIEPIPPD